MPFLLPSRTDVSKVLEEYMETIPKKRKIFKISYSNDIS